MENNESNSRRSLESCQANDWAGKPTGWVIWGSALVVLIAGGYWVSAQSWLWFAGFLLAGVACVANAARCGRRHCYFTGPLFLLMAIYVALTGLHLVPNDSHHIFADVVVAVVVLACLSEHVLGRYRQRT